VRLAPTTGPLPAFPAIREHIFLQENAFWTLLVTLDRHARIVVKVWATSLSHRSVWDAIIFKTVSNVTLMLHNCARFARTDFTSIANINAQHVWLTVFSASVVIFAPLALPGLHLLKDKGKVNVWHASSHVLHAWVFQPTVSLVSVASRRKTGNVKRMFMLNSRSPLLPLLLLSSTILTL
jgi:hypothetical protein